MITFLRIIGKGTQMAKYTLVYLKGAIQMRLEIPSYAIKACQNLNEHGFQAYLVGGAIRDSLLGLVPSDWDLTTDARPEQVEGIFQHSIPTGKSFGTVTVILDNQTLEVTTMRSDGPYSDGRHPDHINFSNHLDIDLSRRDFTINALAYDPLRDQIIDPFLGQKHLRKKLLVTVGDPLLRFQEDPLRMLRLIRFQSTLGFKIEKKTRKTRPGLAWLLSKISSERILMELNKLLLGRELLTALETLYTSGLMEEILPELAAGSTLSAGKSHPHTLLGHAMATAHFVYPRLPLRWAALLHDVGKRDSLMRDHVQSSVLVAKDILHRLRASNDLTETIVTLITHHMFSVHPTSSHKELRKFLAQVGRSTAYDLVKLRQADMAGMNVNPQQILAFGNTLMARFQEILDQEDALTVKDLQISGHDLIHAFTLKPGPIVGQLLNYLLEEVWEDPNLNQRESLLHLAQVHLESLPEIQT